LVFNDANGFDGTIALVGSVATLTITTALTTGSVPFIGTSGALTQDNANLFFDDTNNRLGINTNAPTTALDVFGSGIIGRVNGTSTNNAFLGFASAGTNKWSIGNVQSDHRFRIYNEATTSELVSVLQTGEFGIGIANPTTKIHIDGGASALIANLDANVSVAKSISFRSDNSNRINLEVSGTESGSNAGANLFIRTYTDAGSLLNTPLTIVRSTGAVTFSGAVGIGATAGTNGLFEVSNLGTGVTVGDFLIDAANKNVYIGRLSSTSNDNTNFIVRNRVGTEAFKVTGNTGGISINGSIANSSDTSLISIKQSSTSYTNGIYLERGGERNGYFMYIGGALDALTFRRNYFGTQSDVMSLTRDGNVGIGTSSPARPLHVAGTSDDTFIRTSNTAGGVQFGVTAAGNGIFETYTSTGSTLFYNGGLERMKIGSVNSRNAEINTNGNVVQSFISQPGNIGNGGTTSITIQQVQYEWETSYIYDIVGLYAPSGSNVRAFATGIAHFYTDGSTNDNNVATITSTGWSVSSNSNNSGTFNIVFTNNSGYTQNNINIRVLKINRMN
jgi:hypothetical protein